jgi:hypothetical protein
MHHFDAEAGAIPHFEKSTASVVHRISWATKIQTSLFLVACGFSDFQAKTMLFQTLKQLMPFTAKTK